MVNTISTKNIDWKSVKVWANITVIGIVIYIVIDVILAFLRTDYSLLRNAESDYGRGPYFWLMDINFLLRCLFSLTLSKTLVMAFPKNRSIKNSSYWLIGWAIGSGLLAFFSDNPHGYQRLRSGSTHVLVAFIAFIAIVVAMVLISHLIYKMKPESKTTILLISLCVVAILSLLLLGHTHRVLYRHSLGGLYERIFLASVLIWEATLALMVSNKISKTSAK